MVQFDLPLADLRTYRAALAEPADFDTFWAGTLAAARAAASAPTFVARPTGLTGVEVFDVRFSGWRGDPVAAWLLVPRDRTRPGPAVVEYIGYGAGRGSVLEHLLWSAAGFVHLVVDTRGQGSSTTSVGVTEDDPGPTGPHVPGFMTMGVEDPERYFFRRVFADAVRAVDTIREHPLVDPERVVVTGASQGGGITLAVAGLTPGLAAVMADVPFLCHIRRATEITDSRPYAEIAQYCSAHRDGIERAFGTLSYFDGVSFAARATAPALFSVALMDAVCPPSTVFAAFNAYGHPAKEITVYPYNGHEGGGPFQRAAQLEFATATNPSPSVDS